MTAELSGYQLLRAVGRTPDVLAAVAAATDRDFAATLAAAAVLAGHPPQTIADHIVRHVEAAEARDAAQRWALTTQMALSPHQRQARELIDRATTRPLMQRRDQDGGN